MGMGMGRRKVIYFCQFPFGQRQCGHKSAQTQSGGPLKFCQKINKRSNFGIEFKCGSGILEEEWGRETNKMEIDHRR